MKTWTSTLSVRNGLGFVLLTLLGMTCFLYAADNNSTAGGLYAAKDVLTVEQRQWLSARSNVVRIGVTAIPPQVFHDPETGKLSGLCIDFIDELEKVLSYRFEIVYFNTWNAMMDAAFAHDIDVIYAAQQTPSRMGAFLFTDPYLTFENKIVTTEDVSGPLTLDDLADKTVTVVIGAAIEEYLRDHYPKIQLLGVDDELIGLTRVSFNQADAMVIEIARASWYIQQKKFTNLHIAGDTDYIYQLGFACRNDAPQLTAILNAGLAQLSPRQRNALINHWILPEERRHPNLRILFGTLAVLGLSLLGVFVWNRTLSLRVHHRTAELERELEAHQKDLSILRRYETIISQSEDMMIFVDSDFVYRAANDAYLRTIHKSRDAVIGHTIDEVLGQDYFGRYVRDELKRSLGGERVSFEHWVDFVDRRLYIQGTLHPHTNAAGVIEGVVTVIHDLTDIQIARQAIQRSEEQLRSLFLASPVGIGLLKDRVHLDANDRICEITGYSKEELIGFNTRLLYPTQEDYDNVAIQLAPQIAERGRGQVESRWRRKDGTIIDVLINSALLDINRPEKGASFTALDITERKIAEKALSESRQSMFRLIGNLRGIVYRCALAMDWPMEFISKGCEELVGWTDQDFYTGVASWGTIILPEDQERIWTEISDSLRRHEPFQIEYRICDRAGKVKWFWEKGCGVYTHDGDVIALEGFITDITDRKHIEEALAASESRYRELIDLAVDGILLGSHEGIILEANSFISTLTGRSREQLHGRHISELFETAVLESKPLRFDLLHQGQTVIDERNMLRSDGVQITIEMRTKMMPDGTYQSIVRDITERKKAEESLKESEEKYRSLVDQASEMLFLLDMEGNLIDVNQATIAATGYRRDELLRMTVYDIDPDADARDDKTKIWETLSPLTSKQFEVRHRRKDGTVYWVEVRAGKLLFKGKAYILALANDVTERKQAEALREQLLKELRSKNEELESIVFIASHDLRSPLVNIRGFAGELEKSIEDIKGILNDAAVTDEIRQRLSIPLNTDIPESLHFIKSGNQKMETLLNGLLRLSRIGTAQINPTSINMEMLIGGIINGLRFKIRENNIDIAVDGILPACRGDLMLINQVFVNLIDNAIKYRHPGRPCRIRIRGSQTNGRCVYQVEDNGIGIASEHKEKVFEIFHQLNPGAGGDGLGLTIVSRILDRQDGQIHLDSQPGTGTTLSITLPGA